METAAAIIVEQDVIGFTIRELEAEAELLGHVPDEVAEQRLVPLDLSRGEVAVDRIVEAAAPMRVQTRRQVAVRFAPKAASSNAVERHGVDALQHAAVLKAEPFADKCFAEHAAAAADRPAKIGRHAVRV